MRALFRLALVSTLMSLACSGAAPTSEPRAAPPPALVEEPAPLPAKEPAPATQPAIPIDPEAPWKSLASGVVPRALVDDVTLAPLERPILARAAACDHPKLGGDCNYGGAEVLGFDATSVALVFPPESGHPHVWPLVGEIAGLDGASRERKVITKTGGLEDPDYAAARLKGWRWFASLVKAGFKPTGELVRATALVPRGDISHEPVAFLRAPLAGWMVHVAPAGAEGLAVQLVEPDNQRTHVLASIPVETAERCIDEDGEVGACAEARRYDLASVESVALDPKRERLVVMLSLIDESARAVIRSRWVIGALPAGLVPPG